MHIKKFWTAPISGYQYLSKMLPGSCRYYPTCSEYAKWSFETTAPHRAMLDSTLRILRCNQLFPGGIDYPLIRYTAPSPLSLFNPIDNGNSSKINHLSGKMKIKYWIVPKIDKERYFHVIKDFNAD